LLRSLSTPSIIPLNCPAEAEAARPAELLLLLVPLVPLVLGHPLLALLLRQHELHLVVLLLCQLRSTLLGHCLPRLEVFFLLLAKAKPNTMDLILVVRNIPTAGFRFHTSANLSRQCVTVNKPRSHRKRRARDAPALPDLPRLWRGC
jgi:hypothetical protein